LGKPVKRAAFCPLDHRFQQNRGPTAVHVGLIGHLVHALPDPDARRQVQDQIRIGQCPTHRFWRTDIADEQL
jgi:hypothetical protein